MTVTAEIPSTPYTTPTLNHKKLTTYVDFPLVSGATVTYEPFYVEYDFTLATSDLANTSLYKWNGTDWSEITGISAFK